MNNTFGNMRNIIVAAICILGTGLGACSQAGADTTATAAPTDVWALVDSPATPKVVQARRTVGLDGGGQLDMLLSCDYRPSADPVMNGFWLKLELELKSADGSLGLDPFATDNQTARFSVVRSTGEAGSMSLEISDPTHFVYDNNQTNELNQDNNDPTKVELAQKFDLPLSDGRTVSINMQKDAPGYGALMTKCAPLEASS